jgi:outer membrane protein, multidrug efflux system
MTESVPMSKAAARHSLVSLLAISVLATVSISCAVGPNYRRPAVSSPAMYRGAGAANQQTSLADLAWWEVYKDDTLKGLVKIAMANNYDIRVAAARVEQEREIVAQTRALYFPSVNYLTNLTYGKNQFQYSPSSNTKSPEGFLASLALATWEVDIWGRIRRLNEASRAQYIASYEVRRGVMLSVVSDVSESYLQILGLQLQLNIARQAEQAFGGIRKLFEERFQGGVSSLLPVSRAAADEADVAARIPELERQIAVTEDQISLLLGQNPGPVQTSAKLLLEMPPPEVPAGLPSALLERRPDILSAAQIVHSASARIGVAKAAFFPQFGLTALFGKISQPLSDVTSGSTNAWSLGTGFAGPLFEGGKLIAQKREAVAAWKEATLQYQQTAVSAFRDVSNALISREKYAETRAKQTRAVEENETAVQLALKRYSQGFASYLEVLDAQERLYPTQVALAETELKLRLVIVQLYKALGGGWKLSDEQWMNAQ